VCGWLASGPTASPVMGFSGRTALLNAAVDQEMLDKNPFRGWAVAPVAVVTSIRQPLRSSTGCSQAVPRWATTHHRCKDS
jgi:hypothetical protein